MGLFSDEAVDIFKIWLKGALYFSTESDALRKAYVDWFKEGLKNCETVLDKLKASDETSVFKIVTEPIDKLTDFFKTQDETGNLDASLGNPDVYKRRNILFNLGTLIGLIRSGYPYVLITYQNYELIVQDAIIKLFSESKLVGAYLGILITERAKIGDSRAKQEVEISKKFIAFLESATEKE